MSIPVISPSTTAPTITATSADITALSQDFINFAPLAENAITVIKAAAAAPAVNTFHRFLNIFMAADAAITPNIPNATVQAIGGLGEIVASILQLIPGGSPAPTPAVPVAVP